MRKDKKLKLFNKLNGLIDDEESIESEDNCEEDENSESIDDEVGMKIMNNKIQTFIEKQIKEYGKIKLDCVTCGCEFICFKNYTKLWSLKCKICLKSAKIRDEIFRGPRKAYVPEKNNPKLMETRKRWREQNHDKCANRWKRYRKRQMENNKEDYWKKNAEIGRAHV